MFHTQPFRIQKRIAEHFNKQQLLQVLQLERLRVGKATLVDPNALESIAVYNSTSSPILTLNLCQLRFLERFVPHFDALQARQVVPTRRLHFMEAKPAHGERSERRRFDLELPGVSKASRPQTDREQGVRVQLERLHASEAAVLCRERGQARELAEVDGAIGEEASVGDKQSGERGKVVQNELPEMAGDKGALLYVGEL